MAILKRRDFLKLSGAGAMAVALPRWALNQEAKARPPNFVVFLADDVSPQFYGCYGGKQARTPHLDAMAESGVAFRTCWATPICSPSRAMFLTGRYAQRTGWYHNALCIPRDPYGKDFLAANHTFQSLLKKAGYTTCLVGKWQLPGLPSDGRNGIDTYCIWTAGGGGIPKGQTFNGAMEDDTTPSRYWHPAMVSDGTLLDTTPADYGPDIATQHLINFMDRNRDKPFCAYYPMTLPHGTRTGYASTPQAGPSGDLRHGSLQACTNYSDVLVGRVLKALRERGLHENTIVLYTSDNGFPGKNSATQAGASVPMIVQCPGLIRQRGMTEALIGFADVLPTLLGLAGVAVPADYDLDGMDLSGFLTGKTDRTRDWLFSYIATARMVRDQRWVLEGVDAAYGHPRGWLLDTAAGEKRGAVVEAEGKDAQDARRRFEDVLAQYPAPDSADPAIKPFLDKYDTEPYRHTLGSQRAMKRVVPLKRT